VNKVNAHINVHHAVYHGSFKENYQINNVIPCSQCNLYYEVKWSLISLLLSSKCFPNKKYSLKNPTVGIAHKQYPFRIRKVNNDGLEFTNIVTDRNGT
jgi:hypothetical protein